MNKKSTTLDTIAENLGISKSAVSLALSGKYGVSEETVRKVLLEAVRVGYKISDSTISKRKRVAIIMSSHEMQPGSFFFEILTGINKELSRNNLIMDIRILDDNADYTELMTYLMEHKINRAIAFSDVNEDLIRGLQSINVSMVLVDNRSYHRQDLNHIMANNFLGGYTAAEYLVSAGHTDIVFVGDIGYAISFAERYYGFKERLLSLKNKNVECRFLTSPSDQKISPIFNRKEARELISCREKLPTAIFCTNDPIATEIYMMCEENGVKIPDDVSILSFDNTAICEQLLPRLSSINIPKEEMGATAVNVLLELLKKDTDRPQPARTIQINTQLIERDSVKKL